MLLFLAFYALLFLAPQSGREEILVEAGQGSFQASLSRIEAVIPCNNDVARQELLDENGARVTIVIRDAAGETAAQLTIADGEIHTNGYNSTENLQAEGLPFTLEKGQTYSLEYKADCEGIPLTELSFALYGEEHKLPVLLGAALGLLLCVLGIFLHCAAPGGCSARGYRLLWLALTGLFLISAPKMNEGMSERTAFAEAYAASNLLLGREAADADGYVYIEESGIRNMGYLSYAVPLHRFWSDMSSGNQREEGKISSLYRMDRTGAGQGGPSVLSYLDGAVIALLRRRKAPYQLIYLSGKLLHALLCGLLFLVFLSVWETGKARREKAASLWRTDSLAYEFLPVLFLLPSMLQGGLSYRWRSVLIAAWLTSALFLWNKGKKRGFAGVILLPVSGIVLWKVIGTLQAGENVLQALICAVMVRADEWMLGLVGCYSVSPEALRFPVLLLECVLGYVLVRNPIRSCMRKGERLPAQAMQQRAVQEAAPAEDTCCGIEQKVNRRLLFFILCLIVYIGWKCIA